MRKPLHTEFDSDSDSADSEHTGTSSGALGEGTLRHAPGSPAVEMEQSLVLTIREQCIELLNNPHNFLFKSLNQAVCGLGSSTLDEPESKISKIMEIFFDVFSQVDFNQFLLSFDANSTSSSPRRQLHDVNSTSTPSYKDFFVVAILHGITKHRFWCCLYLSLHIRVHIVMYSYIHPP